MAVFAKHGIVIPQDQEPWGRAFGLSVAAHALLVLLFMSTGKPPLPTAGPVLTDINFIEKAPPPPAPVTVEAEPGKGVADSAPQAPAPAPISQVVSFDTSDAAPPPAPRAVAAPIVSAPIGPPGQMGAIGLKRGALPSLPGAMDRRPSNKGALLMPDSGGGSRKGKAIDLDTEDVGDVRRKAGTGMPLLAQKTPMVSGSLAKPVTGGITQPRKAKVEVLTANAVNRDVWGKKKDPFSMEGPLKYRKIKSMEMPPYPRWAEEKALEATVSFRIWVNSKGKVKTDMYLEKTSGYSELDNLAKEALLKFVFVPLPSNVPDEDEWGVATFRFELKK